MKKLTNNEKIQIIKLYKDGYPKSYISRTLKRSVSAVSSVLKQSGADPQLFRLRVWDETYLWYRKHEEHKLNILWRDLPQEKKEDIYRLVETMVRVEADDFLIEIGLIPANRTIRDLEEENSQLKRLLVYYMSKTMRTVMI